MPIPPPHSNSTRDATDARIRLGEFLSAPDHCRRVQTWLALVDWSRRDHGVVLLSTGADGRLTAAASRRLRLVLDALEMDPAQHRRFQNTIGELLKGMQAVGLVAEAGIPGAQSFLAEASERLTARVLPAPWDHGDLAALLRQMFTDEDEIHRLAAWNQELICRVMAQMVPETPSDLWAGIRRDALDGFRLLSIRVQALGLSHSVRERCTDGPLDASPFMALGAASDHLAQAWRHGTPGAPEAWSAARIRCLAELEEIHRQVQDEGVSVEVVYAVAVIRLGLERMRLLAAVIDGQGPEQAFRLHALVTHLAEASRNDRSLRHLAGLSLGLLHQQIIERSAVTGDHYIAQDRAAYGRLWLAALGGGLLTTGTAAFKAVLAGLHVSAFAHGLGYGLNYSVSFILLQHCHLVLATKQPAMTAASLAGALRDRQGPDRLQALEDLTVRIIHSQIAAACGNILAVAGGAMVLHLVWFWFTGGDFLTAEEAIGIYASLSPLDSGTVWFAAVTGVILWLASLMGGWVDNKCRLHRLPLALRDRGRIRLANLVERHLAGWATSISLGMMLGFTPIIGEFFGLPLDVRHVTLSTGMLALAATSHPDPWAGGFLLRAISGIGVMFVLNLGVSFGLSLYSALAAHGLPGADLRGLATGLWRRLCQRPVDFLVPRRR